jgi:hypothetical protein
MTTKKLKAFPVGSETRAGGPFSTFINTENIRGIREEKENFKNM